MNVVHPLGWGLALSLAALAAQAAGLSYDDALNLAVQRAPMLVARQAALDGAQALRISAAELPDPRISAGLENFPVSGPERFSLVREGMTQRSVAWMQDVPNRDKRVARTAQAEAKAQREQAMLAADTLAVRREVSQAWLLRWSAEQRLAVFAALEAENRLLRDTLAARLVSGSAMSADSTMAAQEALMLADRRDELERERTQAQATLGRWLGDAAAQPLEGDPPALQVDPARIHQGVAQHADLLALEPMQRMAEAEAQEMQAAKKGDWGWQVMVSRRGPSYGDMVSFQLTFELPLWQARRQDTQVTAKRKEAERVAAEREDKLHMRREEMAMQLADLAEADAKAARLQSAALPLAEQRVSLALAAYQAARGDLAAVLTARREKAELQLRAIELRTRQLVLRARLNNLVAESHP